MTAESLAVAFVRVNAAFPQLVMFTVAVAVVFTSTDPKFTTGVSKHMEDAGTERSIPAMKFIAEVLPGFGWAGGDFWKLPGVVGKVLENVDPLRMNFPLVSVVRA